MKLTKLIKENIEANEDYEFYPTTKEIIEALYWDILGGKADEKSMRNRKSISLLDIGAGNCKVFKTLQEISDEQELLPEYTYSFIDNEGHWKNRKLLKITQYLDHSAFDVITSNLAGADIKESTVDLDQLILTLSNTTLDDIDMNNIKAPFHNFTNEEAKERVISIIKNYERGKKYRNEYEREANKLSIRKLMVIEKSQTLIDAMPKEALVVGTDFEENTLIDKESEIIFCNPPYSQYDKWATKIIKEANADFIYLVIPQRWGTNRSILEAIKLRDAKITVIGKFDFLNSEDRKARAKVVLLKVDLKRKNDYYNEYKDPFDLWFHETFKIKAKKNSYDDWSEKEEEIKKRKERISNALVSGHNLIETLVKLYNHELNSLVENYQKLGELDSSILREINVNLSALLSAFKEKIRGLKNLYWAEIFNRLDEITSRLTKKSREKLLSTLTSNTSIDFTVGNIRSVVIWVIKNANHYFNSQILEVYDTFTTTEGINFYKSNCHFTKDTWRYIKANDIKNAGKYALDYRIVLHGYRDSWSSRDEKYWSQNQLEYLKDIIVVAKNLGFNIDNDFGRLYVGDKETIYFVKDKQEYLKKGTKTHHGKIEEVYYQTNKPNENGERVMEKDGIIYKYDPELETPYWQFKIGKHYYNSVYTDDDIFCAVRGFKNGNIHFQFNKKFIKTLNLEVGRLRGWIKSPQEAAEEFDISIEEANNAWKSNFTLLPSNMANLLPDLSNQKLSLKDLESTPRFDPFDWWSTSAKYDELKEGDLLSIINEVEFDVEFDGSHYMLIDRQGAYLGDIDKEKFTSLLECTKRLEDTYFSNYFGARFDFFCTHCGKAVTEDDYAFESHDGYPLCDACSILCESCDKYYTKEEGVIKDGSFICHSCNSKSDEPSNKEKVVAKNLFDFVA